MRLTVAGGRPSVFSSGAESPTIRGKGLDDPWVLNASAMGDDDCVFRGMSVGNGGTGGEKASNNEFGEA
jgi:hypothetical protein